MRSSARIIINGWLLSVALVSGVVRADPFVLDVMETDDLRLLYIDPLQTYLVPHVARSFHNSLEFQRYILNWKPWEKTTVMLTDFSDYANASAGVVPNNSIHLDVDNEAPSEMDAVVPLDA